MANSGGFSIVISAADRASAPLRAINRTLGELQAPTKRANAELGKFAELTGAAGLGRGVMSAVRGLSLLSPAMGAVAAAASIAGVVKLTSDWAGYAQGLGFASRRSGETAAAMAALQGATQMAGGSAEAATNGLTALKDTLYDIHGGRNNEAMLYLRDMKIGLDGVANGTETATTMFPKLAAAIGKIKDPTAQARIATEFFGASADDMLKLINRGPDAIQKFMEAAKRSGGASAGLTKPADDFKVAQAGVTGAVEGLERSLVSRLAPSLTSVMDKAKEAIVGLTRIVDTWSPPAWFTSLLHGDPSGVAAQLNDYQKSRLPPVLQDLLHISHDPETQHHEATEVGQTDAARHILDRLTDPAHHWTRNQALGIIGNLDAESSLNPDMHVKDTDGQIHRGLASWDEPRQEKFRAWAGHGIENSTLDEQIDFVHHELTGTHYVAGERLRNDRTVNQSARDFTELYERPANAQAEGLRRAVRAEQWDDRLPAQVAATPEPQRLDITVHASPGTVASATSPGPADAVIARLRVEHSGVGR
jgi:hypothetical protein